MDITGVFTAGLNCLAESIFYSEILSRHITYLIFRSIAVIANRAIAERGSHTADNNFFPFVFTINFYVAINIMNLMTIKAKLKFYCPSMKSEGLQVRTYITGHI